MNRTTNWFLSFPTPRLLMSESLLLARFILDYAMYPTLVTYGSIFCPRAVRKPRKSETRVKRMKEMFGTTISRSSVFAIGHLSSFISILTGGERCRRPDSVLTMLLHCPQLVSALPRQHFALDARMVGRLSAARGAALIVKIVTS